VDLGLGVGEHRAGYFVGTGSEGPWTWVQRLRLRPDAVGRAVEDVRAFMRAHGKTIGSWWASDWSEPRDLEERLLACGLHVDPDDYDIGALAAVSPPPPGVAGIAVERELRSEHAIRYSALIDGTVVGTARAYFGPRGALLSGGETRPEFRGRGVYRALVRARWDDAVERGTPALIVQGGAMSEPILLRLGFVEVCRFRRLGDVLSSA
jgi:GNAT superfamily N-acetyltransferase